MESLSLFTDTLFGPSATPAPERIDKTAYEKERLEILRELKRVITLLLEQQHNDSLSLTEDDPAVYELLVWIERCLWHGLRRSLVKGLAIE